MGGFLTIAGAIDDVRIYVDTCIYISKNNTERDILEQIYLNSEEDKCASAEEEVGSKRK